MDTKRFFSKCSMQASVLSKRFAKLHLMPETDVFESPRLSHISCQSSGNVFPGSTTYTFSTPKALTFLMIAPMFLKSLGDSITAIKFLQRNSLIAFARLRTELFCFFSSSMIVIVPIRCAFRLIGWLRSLIFRRNSGRLDRCVFDATHPSSYQVIYPCANDRKNESENQVAKWQQNQKEHRWLMRSG